MLPAAPTPQFTQSMLANLAYWEQKCAQGQVGAVRTATDLTNLLRAVQFGLGLPATRQAAARLAVAALHVAEAVGHYELWLTILKKALELCDPADGETHYHLLDGIGQLYRWQQDTHTALEWHQRAETVALTLPPGKPLGRVYFSLSLDYLNLSQHTKALQYARQAQALLTTHGTPAHRAACTLVLGQILAAQGELAAAEALLHESLTFWAGTPYPDEIATTYIHLAETVTAAGRHAEAETHYRAAREILASAGSFMKLIRLEMSYGSFLFDGQQYAEAEAVFRTVETRLRAVAVPTLQALTYNNLGNALLGLRRLAEAENYLREAAALSGTLRADVFQGTALCTLGEVVARQNRAAEAVTIYETGVALLARYPEDRFACRLARKYTTHRDLVAAGRSVDEYGPPAP